MSSCCPTCKCASCTCGDDCRCSEDLCRCQASTLIDSIKYGGKSSGKKKTSQGDALPTGTNPPGDPLAPKLIRAEIFISGMTCGACKRSIESVLQPLVHTVAVNLTTDSAQVVWNPNETTINDIRKAIESVGYSVDRVLEEEDETENDKSTVQILINGMTCTMCSQAIENVVRRIPGVDSIDVSLATDSAEIVYRSQQVTIDTITEAIESVGYVVEQVIEQGNEASDDNVQDRWREINRRQEQKVTERRNAFLWSLLGTLPILFLTMVLPYITMNTFLSRNIVILGRPIEIEALILWLLATPVQFISGFDFYRMSYYGLSSGKAGMDVLVAIGTTASYTYALRGVWTNEDHASHFFETSAVLISFVLLGKWMQVLAVRRTSQALEQLMSLQSNTAVKISMNEDIENFDALVTDFTEETVSIENVHKGDLVKVIRGASIPSDGEIVYGEISVDESMVTGESVPVLKIPGSVVLGGTVCVETNSDSVGAAFIKVTGVGSDTALSKIVKMVQEAQTRTVPIQSFADQISSIFVPTVCIIATLTFMTWYALINTKVVPSSWYEGRNENPATFSILFAITVLVISCPCALGLATPTAVMVGTGVGAKIGVLIKGGEALEICSKVDTIVFDKTGTLTEGRPAITDCVILKSHFSESHGESAEMALLWLLGSLERTSEHPLARAVVQYSEVKLGEQYLEEHPFVQPSKFEAKTGRGASGIIREKNFVIIGNRSFLNYHKIRITPQAEDCMKRLEQQGKTAIVTAIDKEIVAVLGIADKLKADAASAINYLREIMNIDVWMVTGDNKSTAEAIGRQLRMPANRIISEALPAAKVEQVRLLQSKDLIVAMVGDGVNDSPALAQADVGIGLGSGAEIATEAADMVLVKGDVSEVCTAIDLSRVIFNRIRLNFLWSLLYNCLGIPIAAGVFYPLMHVRLPPTVAAIAMALSSISVVFSSLLLRLYTPPITSRRTNRSYTTAWSRSGVSRSPDEGDGMQVSLLANDHLSASEMTDATEVTHNLTSNRIEEGLANVAE